MWKDPDIFRRAIETAKNHMARAAEGRKLLEQGKSLREMQTPITGLDPDQNNTRRADYLQEISGYDDETSCVGIQKYTLSTSQQN